MRRTPEQLLADKESQIRTLKRNLRMKEVPGVKEAVFLARSLRRWADENKEFDVPGLFNVIDGLERCADEPQP